MKPLSKHMEVYYDIKEKIENDTYLVDTYLPAGKLLAETYDCSLMTVTKGIDILVKEGLVIRRRGVGTLVLRKSTVTNTILGPEAGLLDTLGSSHVTSQIHKFEIILPTPEIASKLNINQNEHVYFIIRSRYVDNEAYSIETIYMPLNIIPGLDLKQTEASIYSYIKKDLKLAIQSSQISINGAVASKLDSNILNIQPGHFLINLEKIGTLTTGEIFEYSFTKHVYEKFNFQAVFVNG